MEFTPKDLKSYEMRKESEIFGRADVGMLLEEGQQSPVQKYNRKEFGNGSGMFGAGEFSEQLLHRIDSE